MERITLALFTAFMFLWAAIYVYAENNPQGSLKVTVVDEEGCKVTDALVCIERSDYYRIDANQGISQYLYITNKEYKEKVDKTRKDFFDLPPPKYVPNNYELTDLSGSASFDNVESGRHYISVTHPDYYGNYQLDQHKIDPYKYKATYDTGYVYQQKETEVTVTLRNKPVFKEEQKKKTALFEDYDSSYETQYVGYDEQVSDSDDYFVANDYSSLDYDQHYYSGDEDDQYAYAEDQYHEYDSTDYYAND